MLQIHSESLASVIVQYSSLLSFACPFCYFGASEAESYIRAIYGEHQQVESRLAGKARTLYTVHGALCIAQCGTADVLERELRRMDNTVGRLLA